MNNSTKVVIPKQALSAVKMVMAWWLYVAIILSLIGVVLWLVTIVAHVDLAAWVTVPWITIQIITTILMICEGYSHVDLKAKEVDVWTVAFTAALVGSFLAIIISGIVGSGFYSLWTLIYTVGILAINIHNMYGQDRIGRKRDE